MLWYDYLYFTEVDNGMINANVKESMKYLGPDTNGLKHGHVYEAMLNNDSSSGYAGYHMIVSFDYTDDVDVNALITLASRKSMETYWEVVNLYEGS